MSTCAVYHITVDEGSDYAVSFLYADPCTHLPVDLTGFSATMQVRPTYSGYDVTNPVLSFVSDSTSAAYRLALGGTAGTITLTVQSLDTVNLTWDYGVYDIFLKSPTGSYQKFVKGFFTVIPSATKVNL